MRPPSPVVATEDVAPGSLVVEPPMAHYIRDLDPREQREQVRDWAVLGTVAHLGVSPAEAAAATYELPPARLPYLDELYSFEHGGGRRVYLGQRVLLFRDADDPDPEAAIGRLADRVRMESGEVPPTVEIYSVHDVRDEGTIRVERLPDVTRDELFSPAYGYVEGIVGDAASLTAWLDSADDLTFAQLTGDGHLVLGGRRFAGTRTENLTAEDVAAIYQAHDELEQPRVRAKKWLEKRPMRTRLSIERFIDLVKQGQANSYEAWAQLYSISVPQTEHRAASEAIRALAYERSPGFSLDPEWLPDPASSWRPLVLQKLRAFIANPCGELQQIARRADALERQEPDVLQQSSRTRDAVNVRDMLSEIRQLPEACEHINRELGPALGWLAVALGQAEPADWDLVHAGYRSLVQKLEAANASTKLDPDARALTREALEFFDTDTSVQCGNYFGLHGTRVGMTLFYTDLLAKLWGSDYGRSAPTEEIPGFLATPLIDLPPSFRDELAQKTYTRVWFGPRADAVSRTGAATAPALLFDHRFTRIYAAGSDPARPGVEAQPVESERRSIGWWDQHFEAIANFEPEYHRQNQIMKWAVVTASLADSPAGDFLKQIRVDRSLEFHSWYSANRGNLRFSKPLPAVPAAIDGKECLPLLSSYPYRSAGSVFTISGGVTTAARGVPARVPALRVGEALGARKPYVADLGAGRVGTSARALATRSGEDVRFFNAASARTRTPTGEVRLGTPAVRYKGGEVASRLRIEAGSEERSIGVLELESRSPSRVRLGWADGVVEAERYPSSVASNLAEADRLAQSGDLIGAARSYEQLGPTRTATANDLARRLVVDTAHRRPGPVLQTLQRLEGRGAQLAPQTRGAIERSMADIGTESASKQVSTALRTGRPLSSAEGTLAVERGQIILMRDIEQLPAVQVRPSPTELSGAEVYVDTSLRVGREGLVHDTGGSVASWNSRPVITVQKLDRSAIGALPDRLVVRSTNTILERVTAGTSSGAGRPFVYLLLQDTSHPRPCDAAGQARGSSDDCARQR